MTRKAKQSLQLDWLDYWFAPKIIFVRYSEAVQRIGEITAQGDWISAMAVLPNGYELTVYKRTK